MPIKTQLATYIKSYRWMAAFHGQGSAKQFRAECDATPRGYEPIPEKWKKSRGILVAPQCEIVYGGGLAPGLALNRHRISDMDIIRLGFGCSDSIIDVRPSQLAFGSGTRRSILIEVSHSTALRYPTRRHLIKIQSGGYIIVNEAFHLNVGIQGHGYSRLALALQLRAAALCGIYTIYAMAGGGEAVGGIGHFVWPKLGFDGRIPVTIWDAIPEQQRDACVGASGSPPLLSTFLASGDNAHLAWQKYGSGFLMSLSTNLQGDNAADMLNLLRRACL